MNVWITGGAGFIGCNTAQYLLNQGHDVTIVDNLARAGSERNLEWLRAAHPQLSFHQIDIRDFNALKVVLARSDAPDVIFHFAAQVAVTTSVLDPRTDFDINALGTLNLLEAVRQLDLDPVLLYSSTNKVYGALDQVAVVEKDTRYIYADLPQGVSEEAPLDFYSPYGCSKGAADQYMLDYARIYGLRTIVFRNSCIYGPRQFGVEDQGWLAWFVIAALTGRPITIYGDGKQVRDVLYIHDLIEVMMRAVTSPESTCGKAYNIGGGPTFSLSVWAEFGPMLEDVLGHPITVGFSDWRPGDQRVYVSDISKAAHELDWTPAVAPGEGIRLLASWVRQNLEVIPPL